MYVTEVVVLKDNIVSVDNVVGYFLRDVNTNTVDYYPNEKALPLIDAGEVDVIGRKDGELVIDVKGWFTNMSSKKTVALSEKYKTFLDMVNLAYTVTEEEALAYTAGYPVYSVGPSVKMPLCGMVAPVALLCNDRVKLPLAIDGFALRKEHQCVNYSEVLLPYKVIKTKIQSMLALGLKPIFNTRLALCNPLDQVKAMGMSANALMKAPVVLQIQGEVEYLRRVSEESLKHYRDYCSFDAESYLHEQLGNLYDLLPDATKATAKTKEECDRIIEMCRSFNQQ